MIINLNLQRTDDMQHSEMSSQKKEKKVKEHLLIKATEINNLLRTVRNTCHHHTQEGHRHFPNSGMAMSLMVYRRGGSRCFSSGRPMSDQEVKLESIRRVVESSWKTVQT